MIDYENSLCEYLNEHSIPYSQNHPLKYETYFKQGGNAEFFITPTSIQQLTQTIAHLKRNSIKWKLVGLTSNVYFLSELTYGVIISTKNLTRLSFDGEAFEVDCGYPMIDLVRVTLTHGFGGNEGLEGIPGTVGGAIFMNAGAYGYTISDHLQTVTILTNSGEVLAISKADCEFKHRDSIFKKNPDYIIVSASFKYPKESTSLSAEKIETFHIARHCYQEFAYPNIGSTFSARSDFYLELFHESKTYTFLGYALKLIFKNPLSKLINRKKPTNEHLNLLALKYLNRNNDFVRSKKTLNILINNGKTDFLTLADQIITLRKKLKNDIPLENEIILAPLGGSTTLNRQITERAIAIGALNIKDLEKNTTKQT
ncbi:MAG: hypothetical protein COA41_20265 [Sphingopyxis sp.]|nr:MAG: hypothetical protein COA41_20265 [Sphingopyxis sp.]